MAIYEYMPTKGALFRCNNRQLTIMPSTYFVTLASDNIPHTHAHDRPFDVYAAIQNSERRVVITFHDKIHTYRLRKQFAPGNRAWVNNTCAAWKPQRESAIPHNAHFISIYDLNY